jgi:hypothetical protein
MALNGQISFAGFCPLLDNSGQRSVLSGDGLSANDPERPDFDLTDLTQLPWHFRHTLGYSLVSSEPPLDS